jgi:hypothetical protein
MVGAAALGMILGTSEIDRGVVKNSQKAQSTTGEGNKEGARRQRYKICRRLTSSKMKGKTTLTTALRRVTEVFVVGGVVLG